MKDASISFLNSAHNIFVRVILLNKFFIPLKQELKNIELKLHTLKNKKKFPFDQIKRFTKEGC